MKNFFTKLGWLQLSILLAVSLSINIHFLRQNNLKMVELTQDVIDIDKSSKGDIKKIEPVLVILAEYVSTHMNARMPGPVQLQYRYNRIIDKLAEVKESKEETYRDTTYWQARAHCATTLISVRAECIQQYVVDKGEPNIVDFPPLEQFSYVYSSPAWSPDLAGVTTAVSVLISSMLIFVVITDVIGPRIIAIIRSNPFQ